MRSGSGLALVIAATGCGRLGFEQGNVAGDAAGNVVDAVCPTCDQGLVVHFSLDETAGSIAGESIGMRDGTLMDAAGWQPTSGIRGGALDLQGGYVRADLDVVPMLSGPFTVALWAKLEATSPPYGRFVSNYYWSGVNNGTFELDSGIDGVSLSSKFYVGGTWVNSFCGAFTPATWHHLACVYDGIQQVVCSVDAVPCDQRAASGSLAATEPLMFAIGTSIRPDETIMNRVYGLIDDVRIYNRALSDIELAALATP